MTETPPTISGGPKGSPANNSPRGTALGYPSRLVNLDDTSNMRADNQVLVRATPQSDKGERRYATPAKLRIYRDEAGENIR